jgi:hypothetical protein
VASVGILKTGSEQLPCERRREFPANDWPGRRFDGDGIAVECGAADLTFQATKHATDDRGDTMSDSLNPQRTIAELKELRALTGDQNGAQRVAFTDVWLKAREWLREKLQGLPVEIATDAAGNRWPHGFGAEWRLARWLSECHGGRRNSAPLERAV